MHVQRPKNCTMHAHIINKCTHIHTLNRMKEQRIMQVSSRNQFKYFYMTNVKRLTTKLSNTVISSTGSKQEFSESHKEESLKRKLE